MKLYLSLAAAPLTKGQYVIVKYGKDDWFAGTVTTVSKNGGYTVTFNEGTVVKFPDSRKLKPISKKGKKGQYSDEAAKALLSTVVTVKPKTSTSPSLPTNPVHTIDLTPTVTVPTVTNITVKPLKADEVSIRGIDFKYKLVKTKPRIRGSELPEYKLVLYNEDKLLDVVFDNFLKIYEVSRGKDPIYAISCPIQPLFNTYPTLTSLDTSYLEKDEGNKALKRFLFLLNNPQSNDWKSSKIALHIQALVTVIDKNNQLNLLQVPSIVKRH